MGESVVVDKSFLEQPDLEKFLGDSSNRVVLTDFSGVESFAGTSELNLVRSTEILSRFPKQVFVLKSFKELAQLGPIDPNLRFEMVDWKLSRDFGELCAQIRRAGVGDQEARTHFLERAAAAKHHLDVMRDGNSHLVQLIKVLKKYTGDDLLKARRGGTSMPGPEGVRLL